jgi:hypothetical protein
VQKNDGAYDQLPDYGRFQEIGQIFKGFPSCGVIVHDAL